MNRAFRTLRRMVSWSKPTEDVPISDADQAAVPPPAPPPSKPVKRKYSGSDDEDEASITVKKAREDDGEVSLSTPHTPAPEPPTPAAEDPPSSVLAGPEKSDEVPGSDDAPASDTKEAAGDETGSPAAAPDSPEAAAEAPSEFPELKEDGENVFLTWVDGIRHMIGDTDDFEPVLWLRSQILEVYENGPPSDSEDADADVDPSVCYWGPELDEESLKTPPGSAWRSEFSKTYKANHKALWWEVTVVRQEPEDTPRIKVSLESSLHDHEHNVWGGHKLGDWWITKVQPATDDATKAMQTHRDLY